MNILPISFFIFALLALPAMAVTHSMTGNMSTDWGVNLTKAYDDDKNIGSGNEPTSYAGWVPKDSSVDWIVENNIDKRYEPNKIWIGSTDLFVWAGGKYGTHKMKTGTSNSIVNYDEPTIYCTDQKREYIQPAGGEAYDIEALYFDDDNQYAYLAIVTSMPEGGAGGFKMGDIALDLTDQTGKLENDTTIPYEFGIKVLENSTTNLKVGNIVSQPIWTKPPSYEFENGYPLTIESGRVVGSGTVEYFASNIPSDNDVSNSIIEVRIPRNLIGNPTAGQLSNIHLTIGCGNDVIELTPVKFKTNVPEFPSVALPVAAIIGILFVFGRRNKE